MLRIFRTTTALILAISAATAFSQSKVYVWQESAAGAGDFAQNFVGEATAFEADAGQDSVAAYNYGAASYNPSPALPPATNRVAQLFFVDADDGLSLFGVFDQIQGSYGRVLMSIELFGDDADVLVADDNAAEVSEVSPNLFDVIATWAPCCTDGFVIGNLDGGWSIVLDLVPVLWAGSTVENFIVATNDAQSELHLDLGSNRRVLFSTIEFAIEAALANCAIGVKNHGEYVSCTAKVLNGFVASGDISETQKGELQSIAAKSDVGKPANGNNKGGKNK